MCRIATLALLLSALIGAPSLAQDQAEALPPATLEEGLHRLHQALLSLQELFAQQAETEALQLFLERSALTADEISRLEQRLWKLQDEQRATLEEQTRLARAPLRTKRKTADGETEELPYRIVYQEAQAERQLLDERLKLLEQQILQLQNELKARREELRGWQDIADRRLGGV